MKKGNISVCFVHAFRVYEEIQKIEANEFHYQEQVRIQIFMCCCIRCKLILCFHQQFPVCQIDPIEYVEDVCENMQLFPKEDFLTGDQLMFEFDPEVSTLVV